MGAGALSRPSNIEPEPGTSTDIISMGGNSCAHCNTAFTLFKRKKQCAECGRQMCSSCVVRLTKRPGSLRQCHMCIDVYKGNFQRKDLNILQLRDLKYFLSKNKISTDKCKEKHDLVELILKHYGNEQYRQAQIEHQQYVNILKERRELEDEDSSATESAHNSRPGSPEHNADPPLSNQIPSTRTETTNQNTGNRVHSSVNLDAEAGSSSNQQPETAVNEESHTAEAADEREQVEDITENQNEENTEDISNVPKRRASIADLERPEDTEMLSIRQLKEILARHFVDYKGCCERWELQDRVQRLWHECRANENKANEATGDTEETCRVCMDAVIDCVLLECGHMVSCTKCGKRLSECPICRQFVIRAVHVFRS